MFACAWLNKSSAWPKFCEVRFWLALERSPYADWALPRIWLFACSAEDTNSSPCTTKIRSRPVAAKLNPRRKPCRHNRGVRIGADGGMTCGWALPGALDLAFGRKFICPENTRRRNAYFRRGSAGLRWRLPISNLENLGICMTGDIE